MLQVTEHRFPKTMVSQAVPLQPMEDHGGAEIHLGLSPARYLGCDPMGNLYWSRVLVPVSHGERSPCWSRFAGTTCDPAEQSAPEELHHVERDPHWSS